MNAERRDGDHEIPFACVPGAIPAAERAAHFAMTKSLFAEAREKRVVVDGAIEGYALRFDAGEFDRIARFVANERLCCPVLTFAIELSSGSGPVWLRMSGRVGTREFLEAELPLQDAAR